MPITGFNAQLLGQLEMRSASAAQVYLMQRVARSIQPDTLLSQHAASLAGMAVELPRAQAALLSYGDRLQPQKRLLGVLCRNAEASVVRTLQFRPDNQVLNAFLTVLRAVPALLIDISIPESRNAAISLSRQLGVLLKGLPELLIQIFTEAWRLTDPEDDDWMFIEHACDELACFVASRDRDYGKLESELSATIRRKGLRLEDAIQLLVPDLKTYSVACIVRGASRFASLTDLEQTAQQSSSDAKHSIEWGVATKELNRFLAKHLINSGYCALSVDVEAVDWPSAARLGRRRVSELLDQYIAGHRAISLDLDPVTLVNTGLHTREWEVPRANVDLALPLVKRWPEGFREGLRMSHLARTTNTPMAAAALSWVALEACGLEYSNRGTLAKALSLQALRQQVVETHQMIRHSIAASTLYWNNDINSANRFMRNRDVALSRIPETYVERREEVARLRGLDEERLSYSTERLWDLTTLSRKSLAVLNSYAAVDSYGHLADVNCWADNFLPTRPADKEELHLARMGLAEIIPHLTPLASRQIRDWQYRFSVPGICAEWISATKDRIEALLAALYSARNLSLHSGIFSAAGDAVLGQGGVILVDFTFEFLGNWYRNTSPEQREDKPDEVIEALADRQEGIVTRLSTHFEPPYPLNIDHLTSPTSSEAWDRE